MNTEEHALILRNEFNHQAKEALNDTPEKSYRFEHPIDFLCFKKSDIQTLANENGVVNLIHLFESTKYCDEAQARYEAQLISLKEYRLARREFSDVINIWVEKGYGEESGYADIHQFILSK
jgi:hypothetical protein